MFVFEKELTGNKLHTQLKKKILCVLLLVDFELKELSMDVNQFNLKDLWHFAFPNVPLDYQSIVESSSNSGSNNALNQASVSNNNLDDQELSESQKGEENP